MKLTTSCGTIILIDKEDIDLVSSYTWHIRKVKNTSYARSNIRVGGKQIGIHLHRLITNCPKNMMVDHINGDGLDNRRCNLRIVTRSQNLMNSNKPKRQTSSKYKGVNQSASGKWRAEIRKDTIGYYLGTFLTEKDAAIAYNNKAIELFGKFAKLNEVT